MGMWAEIAENNKDFKEEFNKLFNNKDIKEADDGFTADLYHQYVNMDLKFDRGGYRTEFTRVKKILKDANFRPIGITNDNSIIYSLMYELEYNDGHTASLAANLIATCVQSLGETQGRSTNQIPRNQVSHDIQHQAW